MTSCIYKVTNKTTGKIYIGRTNNLRRRKNEHKNHAKKDGGNFHSDIRKYGFDDFDWDVLCECDEQTLDELEIQYIKEHRETYGDEMIYNITKGGPGGQTHDVSGSNNPMYGRPKTQAEKDHLSSLFTGKKMPDGFGEKMSMKLKGVPKKKSAVAKRSHYIIMYDVKTGDLDYFPSKSEMERTLGCNTLTVMSGKTTKSGHRLYKMGRKV